MSDVVALTSREELARRLVESLKRQLGAAFCDRLADPAVFELLLNADGQMWEDRAGVGMSIVGKLSATAAESFIGTVASMLRSTVTRENPILECTLPDTRPFRGARFSAVLPPIAPAPMFSIRMKASAVFSLANYVERGIMTPGQRDAIEHAAAHRQNILVIGGTGTGKTTLTNAIIGYAVEAAPDLRWGILEDVAELQCVAANKFNLLTSTNYNMQGLLKHTLRQRPDRIVVGEVRDRTALDLLKAWNTGHPGGVSTVHANRGINAGLTRIEQLVAEGSASPMQAVIAEAVNMMVFIERASNQPGRIVAAVVSVSGFRNGEYQLETLG